MRSYFFLIFALCVQGFANPSGASIMHGEAQISPIDAQSLHINASDQAIIHWENFSIGENELTKFIQPNIDATVLNRVMGTNFSEILGRLESNGHVVLLNPNGILVGKNASVETGSFTASTLDVLDEHFLTQNEWHFQGLSENGIVNLGKIEALSGDVLLASYEVDNQGKISAPNGVCGIGVSTEVIMVPEDSPKILIRPNLGSESETGLSNSGSIEALQVELKAYGTPYEYAIQQSGEVRARGIVEKDGKVLLVAEKGVNMITGHISCKNENDVGGDIHILGEKIALIEEAKIDASGMNGGGNVLVGGDFQGQNKDIMNAEYVTVGPDARIYTNAQYIGNAGKAIFWADGYTRMYGTVDASGGKCHGNGGLIEVSGALGFDYKGRSIRTAPFGTAGELILDPEGDVTIIRGNAGPTDGSFSGGVFTPLTGTTSIVNGGIAPFGAGTIGDELSMGPVTIQTGGATVGPFPPVGDIIIGPGGVAFEPTIPISGTVNRLSLVATGDIIVQPGGRSSHSPISFTGNNMIMTANSPLVTGDTVIETFFPPTVDRLILDLQGDLIMNGTNNALIALKDNIGTSIVHIRGDVLIDVVDPEASGSGSGLAFGTGRPGNQVQIDGDLRLNVTRIINFSDGFDITFRADTGRPIRVNGDVVFNGPGPPSPFYRSSINLDASTNISIGDFFFNSLTLDNGAQLIFSTEGATGDTVNVFINESLNVSNSSNIRASNSFRLQINFIVDNAFPTPPGIGPGAFNLDATSFVDYSGSETPELRFFTADRTQNNILGTIRGSPFVPGPFNVDSSTEVWNTYYFSATPGTGDPFTIYYKGINAILENPIVQQSRVAQAEALIDMQFFEELIFSFVHFNSKAFVRIDGEEILLEEIPFYQRVRNFGTNITKQVGEVLPDSL